MGKGKQNKKATENEQPTEVVIKKEEETAEGVTEVKEEPEHEEDEPEQNEEVDGDADETLNKTETERFVSDPERDARTIFVGNWPETRSNDQSINEYFQKFGDVESSIFRAPRVNKNQKKNTSFYRYSRNATVIFKTKEDAAKALAANNTVVEHHLLRVRPFGPNEWNNCIFVGGLPPSIEKDELCEVFEKCGTIASIRIVRKVISNRLAPYARVFFENEEGVEKALALGKLCIDSHYVRVSKHEIRRQQNGKKRNIDEDQEGEEAEGEETGENTGNDSTNDGNNKKKFKGFKKNRGDKQKFNKFFGNKKKFQNQQKKN